MIKSNSMQVSNRFYEDEWDETQNKGRRRNTLYQLTTLEAMIEKD